jgi:hypothetical protein
LDRLNRLLADLGETPLNEHDYLPVRAARNRNIARGCTSRFFDGANDVWVVDAAGFRRLHKFIRPLIKQIPPVVCEEGGLGIVNQARYV